MGRTRRFPARKASTSSTTPTLQTQNVQPSENLENDIQRVESQHVKWKAKKMKFLINPNNKMKDHIPSNPRGCATNIGWLMLKMIKEGFFEERLRIRDVLVLPPHKQVVVTWSEENRLCQSGFIERIVEDAFAMLPPKRFHNSDYVVGLEPHIEEVMSLLDNSDDGACRLGIHGLGGIGKTTLAKAIYNSIFYQFEGSCFLFDVREESKKFHGNVCLQQTLLSEILEEKRMKFGSVHERISKMKHRLSQKKVLLVLDDVDEPEQIEELAGGCDWFGPGSKVIITTRDKQLLLARNVEKTYEMKKLNDHDSLKLFCWHAFHTIKTPKGYQDMARHVISYAQGLPLALRVIGSNLAYKNLEEWGSILEKYDRIPGSSIHEVLKISYDCLQDGAKSIFLDVACFFTKEILESVEEILEACHSGARFYIEILVDKSLLAVDRDGRLWMHDLIQSMGKAIVRQEAPSNPGKRSRIWDYKDILTVLHEDLSHWTDCGLIRRIKRRPFFHSYKRKMFFPMEAKSDFDKSKLENYDIRLVGKSLCKISRINVDRFESESEFSSPFNKPSHPPNFYRAAIILPQMS
ncbi:hypothetical protein K1719_031866 [Acacia pycnantha]|nr:hypothetical protein K1719_031866 [Acacia pycnantha]